MKKFFSFIAIVGIILASNCSRIPENNDPVIGIWTRIEVNTSETGKQTIRRDWIFNDAYLGRYHRIENGAITVKTDFRWKKDDSIYTISYPGIDKSDNNVIMKESPQGIILEDSIGNILAIRE